MDAQGALDSFLGRLTAVLVNEAQLLGRVRGDVEFIKEEMECMNSLILQLTEAQYRDHLVRAWMKQVVGLTRDCEGNVEHYIHYVGSRPGDDGLLGHLRRVLRFLRTIAVRHRIATRIRELKVRARDVGDRRQRYGVTVPASTRDDKNNATVDVEPAREEVLEDLRRCAVLLDAADESAGNYEDVETRVMDTLIEYLTSQDGARQPQVRVFNVLCNDEYLANYIAKKAHQHPSLSTLFSCKARSSSGQSVEEVLQQISAGVQRGHGQVDELRSLLKGQRFFIVFSAAELGFRSMMEVFRHVLQAAEGCLPGSAIIMTTCVVLDDWGQSWLQRKKARNSCSCNIIDARHEFMFPWPVVEFYMEKARYLGANPDNINYKVLELCAPNLFAMKTFLHLLYVNPYRKEDELQIYENTISECRKLKRSISNQVLLWCYSELPSKYRSCLLYLTIFPQGHVFRATSLARRWLAEGLITAAGNTTSTAIDVLCIRGFVSPLEISAEGNVKSFTVHPEVREFISRVATDVNFMDSNLPPHLARYLSIHNRIGLQKSHSDGNTKNIAAYLPSLSASPQWQLLKVLDLEGCKGLDKKHMKSICKILLLKYLSLRNTDIAELPKQIKELQCLETLDIRQTKVQMLSKIAVVLPLLKHLLAGHGQKVSGSNGSTTPEEPVSTMQMPLCIEKMDNMEILSHVQVSNSKELAGIAELLKLRKLGVALCGTRAKLSDLFRQIDKLQKCLRSLSVRINEQAVSEKHDALTPPKFITSLNVSGLTSGLPHMIQELHQLVKLTMTETHLKADGLRILGKLHGLRILRLQNKAYTESELSFKEDEFQILNFLLVGTTDVTNISFANGAAPKLERIIWSFPTTACVSGLKHIPDLRVFELNGDCNPDQVRDEIQSLTISNLEYVEKRSRTKLPVFKYNLHLQRQDYRAAASASSSSAS